MKDRPIKQELLELKTIKECSNDYILAVNDTMNVLQGKWKIPIIAMLLYGKKRFGELERGILKITPRMLSKELRDLEANGILKRTVHDTIPISVDYELTKSGQLFGGVLEVMLNWGLQHRENTLRDM